KPLVVMSPKSLLRHKRAVSPLADFIAAGFRNVIDDEALEDPRAVRRIVLTSGRFYYTLLEARESRGLAHAALVRVERLYPVPRLAESISEATLVAWLKQEGETVGPDEPIATLETDKAAVELPAGSAGVLHHAKKIGETVVVGDTIARIDENAAPAGDDAKAPAAAATRAEPQRESKPQSQRGSAPEAARELPRREAPAAAAAVPDRGDADDHLAPAVR